MKKIEAMIGLVQAFRAIGVPAQFNADGHNCTLNIDGDLIVIQNLYDGSRIIIGGAVSTIPEPLAHRIEDLAGAYDLMAECFGALGYPVMKAVQGSFGICGSGLKVRTEGMQTLITAHETTKEYRIDGPDQDTSEV